MYYLFQKMKRKCLAFSSIYTYCELEPLKEGQTRLSPVYETKAWAPPALTLQEIALNLKMEVRN